MSVQVSTHIDEATKRQFDNVCANIGVSPANALNIFIRGVISHNGIPFSEVASPEEKNRQARERMLEAFKMAQAESVANGTDVISMEEINAEIAACKRERKAV
jgi:DNA-damage-inducible protein J